MVNAQLVQGGPFSNSQIQNVLLKLQSSVQNQCQIQSYFIRSLEIIESELKSIGRSLESDRVPSKKRDVFSCTHPNCTKQYYSNFSLKRHIQRKHTFSLPTHFCRVTNCSKKFFANWERERHQRTHVKFDSQPYQCKRCPQKFEYFNDLSDHNKRLHIM